MPKDKYKASRYGGFDQGQSGRGQPTIAGRKARLKKISKKKRPAKYKKLMNKLAELRTKRSQTPKPPEKNHGVTPIGSKESKPLPPMSEMLRSKESKAPTSSGAVKQNVGGTTGAKTTGTFTGPRTPAGNAPVRGDKGTKYSDVAAKLVKKRKKRQFKSKAVGKRPGF